MKYKVKNWEQFQHYSDRNPPWIKLHFSLLSSEDWVMLSDASRLLAVVIMLIASRDKGAIDGSSKGLQYLQRVAYLDKKPNLKPLIDTGFLVPLQADASESKQKQANDPQEDMQSISEEIILEENTCPELKSAPAPPPDAEDSEIDPLDIFLIFPTNKNDCLHSIMKSDVESWAELYPAVDVEQELRNMKGWLNANPKKRKTKSGIPRFINAWLSKEQDKGGSIGSIGYRKTPPGDPGNWGPRELEPERTTEEIEAARQKAEKVLRKYHKL